MLNSHSIRCRKKNGLGGSWLAPHLAIAFLLCGATTTVAAATRGEGTLSATLADSQSGKPVHARVYLANGETALLPRGFTAYDKLDERHILVPPSFRISLPAGDYSIRIERGKEYYPLEESFTIEAETELTRNFKLKRWINMESRGWYSGDLHIHRPAEAMTDTVLAEDLNVAPVITVHQWGPWDSRRKPVKMAQPLVQVDAKHLYTLNGYEIERIVQGPGAVLLYGLDLKFDPEGDELHPPASVLTRRAREQGGHVDGDKVFWLDVPVNVALSQIDSIEIACNHFFPRGVDADLRPWASWKPEPEFEGNKGFALWIMDLYYKLLNCGFDLPVSGGSACGVKPLPVGYSRVYVKPEAPFSHDAFFTALKQGKSFSTNGPMLNLKVNGQGMGSRIVFKRGLTLDLEATAEAANPLDSLEIVVNGQVVESVPGDGSHSLRLRKSIKTRNSVWVAARAFEQSKQTVVFGQTSPIHFLRNGVSVRVPADIRFWLNKVDQLIARARTQEGFAAEAHRKATLQVYELARKIYADMLAE